MQPKQTFINILSQCNFLHFEQKKTRFLPHRSSTADKCILLSFISIDKKHEFSFISKMLHTINTTRPIYDSRVGRLLKLGHGYWQSVDQRMKKDVQILGTLSETYQYLYASGKLNTMLDELDERTPGFQMSVEKKMDFILWALDKVLK